MGLSKSTRIAILLAIDSAFFLLELVVGKQHLAVAAAAVLTPRRLFCPLSRSGRRLFSHGL